jgi:hypothetical protein
MIGLAVLHFRWVQALDTIVAAGMNPHNWYMLVSSNNNSDAGRTLSHEGSNSSAFSCGCWPDCAAACTAATAAAWFLHSS